MTPQLKPQKHRSRWRHSQESENPHFGGLGVGLELRRSQRLKESVKPYVPTRPTRLAFNEAAIQRSKDSNGNARCDHLILILCAPS